MRDDDSIKAIVLRIDSPGGSSVASDVIWRELMITREDDRRGRSSSMSDLARPGGYYIAMPARSIVAQPATLTGSIGIFGGKIAIGGTLEQDRRQRERSRRAQRRHLFAVRAVHPGAARQLQEYMQGFYDDFVEKAAESRKTTPEQIRRRGAGARLDRSAGARARAGRRARRTRRRGAIAKERAKIPADEDVELVVYPDAAASTKR